MVGFVLACVTDLLLRTTSSHNLVINQYKCISFNFKNVLFKDVPYISPDFEIVALKANSKYICTAMCYSFLAAPQFFTEVSH